MMEFPAPALPHIDVVIIGVNVERYIEGCVDSVRRCDYPQELLHLIYVDGGSRDRSAELARAMEGVRVIELKDPHPTPGRGRNRGYEAGTSPFVQFLDADTELDRLWFRKALPLIRERVVALCGRRRERYPDKNLYHVFGSIEWSYEEGPCRYFGGDVLIRREVLKETGGFDENLIAGEDPELSYRVRLSGWTIYRIGDDMTTHDLNMTTFRQYLRRSFRSGYAYGEIGLRFSGRQEKLWLRESLRVVIGAMAPLILFLCGFFSGYPWTGAFLGLAMALRALVKIPSFSRRFGITLNTAFLYALHLSFVVYPQLFGLLRYLAGLIRGKPLQNKGYTVEAGAR